MIMREKNETMDIKGLLCQGLDINFFLFFIPFAREIKKSNLLAGLPPKEWVLARIDGEEFNNAVRVQLKHFFAIRPNRANTSRQFEFCYI